MDRDIRLGLYAMENEEALDELMEDFLAHEGRSLASGRYPLGSGKTPYERERNFRTTYASLVQKGWKETEIAKHFGFKSTSDLRARVAKSKEEVIAYEVHKAWKLKNKGLSITAISQEMYHDKSHESTVRNRLKQAMAPKETALRNTAEMLKKELEKHPYLQVGEGVELYLGDGITSTRLNNALSLLVQDGYSVHSTIQVEQLGTLPGQKTTVKVLTKGGVTDKEVYDHLGEVEIPGSRTDDGGLTYKEIKPPESISSDRVYIRYAEDGGVDKDGVIELRPGVKDLSLGGASYAQSRIAVDGTHYLKGMAMYGIDIPEGYDVVFNTNKHRGTPKMDVLKPMQDDPANPFGASIIGDEKLILARQRDWTDDEGNVHQSAVNIVNEEGKWSTWSKTISAQMLSKQPPALAKQQLDLTYQLKRQEFEDIMALTNPVVKRKLLEEFAESCDSAAVHMKAHGFPGQTSRVILPMTELPENQVYAPGYPNGTEVVLIRFPHASIKEIPSLIVNNDIPAAKKIFERPPLDAICINPKVATQLSGADFDGDTVLVIPNNEGHIKHEKYFRDLIGYDPKEAYPGYDGMKKMTKQQRGREMGVVTNLITDMTVQGAPEEDLVRAIKHSMVVIDAYKHGLDWRRSERENGILELKKRYQDRGDGRFGGAGTLISKATSEEREPWHKQWNYQKNSIDPETGEKIYNYGTEYDRTYYKKTKDGWKPVERTLKNTKMGAAEDARDLISPYNTAIERVYANYANGMKALANEARKAWLTIPHMKQDAAAKDLYMAERISLSEKLKAAKMNKPLERKAQILANLAVGQYLYEHPEVKNDGDTVKKLKGRTLQQKRDVVGASKNMVTFTPREWEAVQAGAVSENMFKALLDNAKTDHVKQLATPRRQRAALTPGQKSNILRMVKMHFDYSDIAEQLGVSVSQITNLIKEQ